MDHDTGVGAGDAMPSMGSGFDRLGENIIRDQNGTGQMRGHNPARKGGR